MIETQGGVEVTIYSGGSESSTAIGDKPGLASEGGMGFVGLSLNLWNLMLSLAHGVKDEL